MKIEILKHLISDYFYAIRKHIGALIISKSLNYYLENAVAGKRPVILIPGVLEKWNFLKEIADELSAKGYPVYTVDELERNTKDIPCSAKLVSKFIDKKNLENVIIVAHSKGGLIGKYILAFYNSDEKIKKMISIATPFGGSNMVRFVPYKFLGLSPTSDTVKLLQNQNDVNCKIVSIFGIFDNHVWPLESCRLEGAKNIQVEAFGHHKILADKKVIKIVADEISK